MLTAPPQVLTAPVVAVTVHRNGALVVRRGVATTSSVRVTGLPLLFAADSLRVRPERGQVRGLREQCTLDVRPMPPPADQAERTALQYQALHLDDEDRTLGAEIQLLEKLAPTPPPASARPRLPDATGWSALSEAVRERLRTLDATRAALQVRRRALARERTELDRRAAPEPAPPRFHRGLEFRLHETGEGPVAIELEYFVEAARWLPAWRLELSGAVGRLYLEAFVAQASGEDWSGAHLSFSTADLRRETTVPELRSWRIGPAQPAPRPAFRPLPAGLEALFGGYDRARRPSGPPPRMQSAPQSPGTPAPAAFAASLRREVAMDTGAGAYDDDAEGSAELSLREDTAVSPPPPPAPKAMPSRGAPERSRMAAAAPAMNFGGGGPPGAAVPEVMSNLPPALPPRLRYPWLRLAGPEEPGRGSLTPMDPFTQLWTLVEGQGTAAPDQLRRAIDALADAAWRLRSGPPPAGTRPLPETHFQSVFASPAAHDVPGDGQFHRVRVTEETTTARAEWRCVPREAPEVWRYCVLSARQDVPRPAGPLAVYRDGEFLATSVLDAGHAGPDGALALNLGVEPDLRITHRGVHLHQEDKGLVGQSTRIDHRITVKMRSTLSAPARILLYDRLPVPADERQEKDIEVQLLESQPSPVRTGRSPENDTLAGGLVWTLEVSPGEQTVLELTYRVILPASFELDGGNRREN